MPTVDLESARSHTTSTTPTIRPRCRSDRAHLRLRRTGCGVGSGSSPALDRCGGTGLTFDNRGMHRRRHRRALHRRGSRCRLSCSGCRVSSDTGRSIPRRVGHSIGRCRRDDRIQIRTGPRRIPRSCNVASPEKTITTVERDLARLGYDLPPLFLRDRKPAATLPNFRPHGRDRPRLIRTLIGDMARVAESGRLGQYEACLAWSTGQFAYASLAFDSRSLPGHRVRHDIDSPTPRAREAPRTPARATSRPRREPPRPFTHPVAVADALIDFLASE